MVLSCLAGFFFWGVVIHEKMISFQLQVMNTLSGFFAPTPFSLWEKNTQPLRQLTLYELR